MSRIRPPARGSTTGATAEVYARIKKALGRVPNTFAGIGAHGPAAPNAQADGVLAAGTPSRPDQEAGSTHWFPSRPRHLPAIAIPLVALALFGLAGCKNIEIGPPSSPSCCHGGGR